MLEKIDKNMKKTQKGKNLVMCQLLSVGFWIFDG